MAVAGGYLVPCREVRQVVAAVREGRADAGCLAIENSLFGSVTATYDLLHDAFGDGELHLSDEILLPVYHALLGFPGATLSEIRRVLSHPVALGQCRHLARSHLPQAELVNEWDTAGSAEIVAREGRRDQAAIAPLGAGGAYGLATLAERIEDDPTNQTRFLTFTRERRRRGAGDGRGSAQDVAPPLAAAQARACSRPRCRRSPRAAST